jgi:hypothetical protein
MEPNPYESPQLDNSRQFERNSSRLRSIILGLWIGLCIGGASTVCLFLLSDGPNPPRLVAILVFPTAFSATGIMVGAYQRNSVRVGTVSGLIFMSAWAVVCNIGHPCERNPWAINPWIVVALPVFGGVGVIGGGIIGMIFSRIRKAYTKPTSDEKDALDVSQNDRIL